MNFSKNINENRDTGIIRGLLFYFLPIISFFIFSFPEKFTGDIFLLLGIFLVLPYGFSTVSNQKKYKILLYFLVLVFLGSLLNLANTRNGIGGSILLFGVFSLSLFFIKNMKTGMYLSAFYLLYLYLFLYAQIFIDGTDPNFIYEEIGLSRNHPGCMIVSFLCFYAFFKYLTTGKLPLVSPIIGGFITFFLEGRSSFGVTIAIALVCLVFRSKKKSHLLLYFFLTIAILAYFWDDLMFYYSVSRLSEKGTDNSARDIIWDAYISNLDFPSFFLGLDAEKVRGLAEHSGNPHNSFLNFHRRMGLIGLMSLLVLMYISIRKYFKHKHFMPILIITLYTIRIFFDSVLVSSFDFIFYTFLFYPLVEDTKVYPYQIMPPDKNIFQKSLNKVINIL